MMIRPIGFGFYLCLLALPSRLLASLSANNLTNSVGRENFLNLFMVEKLRDDAHNITRDKYVLQTLQDAAGVYHDKEKGKTAGLEKTVFITIISFNTVTTEQYKSYFLNFLCFTQHYDIDLIVYIVHHNLPDVEKEIRSLQQLGVKVITYPDERFWNLLSTKESKILNAKNCAQFDDVVPSFQKFGALVMLIPQLEILELGFNVIYFDVDIGLVQDPVPYITRGDADFTTSSELKSCPDEYPSSLKMDEDWQNLEPNTGVMHVRATTQGIAFYKNWLKIILKRNMKNDQTVFKRDGRIVQTDTHDGVSTYSESNFTSRFTPTCNWDYKNTTVRATPIAATYCFLSEMMFQNGKIGFFCSNRPAGRDNWYNEMVRQVPEVQVNGQGPFYRLPVAIHANFCNKKSFELEVRGLWLYYAKERNSSDALQGNHSFLSCKAYNASNVFYAKVNWTMEIENFEAVRQHQLKVFVVNGTLIKPQNGMSVWLISPELQKRIIPDEATFIKLGYEWENVRIVSSAVIKTIPDGPPFKSVSLK